MTLAGEAAHMLPVQSDTALNNAIEDACAFVNTVKGIARGERIRAQAIPSFGNEIVARAARASVSSDDPLLSVLKLTVLNTVSISHSSLAVVLDACDEQEKDVDSFQRKDNRDINRDAMKFEKCEKRKKRSQVAAWLSRKVENLDVGAEDGTAQTGWVALGYRQYGRRHFPK